MFGLSLGAWPFLLLLLLLPIGWKALEKRRVRLPLPGIGAATRSARGEVTEAPGPVRLRRFTLWSAWAPVWRTAAH